MQDPEFDQGFEVDSAWVSGLFRAGWALADEIVPIVSASKQLGLPKCPEFPKLPKCPEFSNLPKISRIFKKTHITVAHYIPPSLRHTFRINAHERITLLATYRFLRGLDFSL